MIVQSFRSVIWVGAVAGAAISCYMVSLRVASERASLERVESRILMAKRDIRALDTELGTRGRIRQLERWNTDVLALAAPTEGQFLEGETQLAGLTRMDAAEPAPVLLAVQPRTFDPVEAEPAQAKSRIVLAAYRTDDAERPARVSGADAPRLRATTARNVTAKSGQATTARKAAMKAETASKPKRTVVKVATKTATTPAAKPARETAVRKTGAPKVKVADRAAKSGGKVKPGKSL